MVTSGLRFKLLKLLIFTREIDDHDKMPLRRAKARDHFSGGNLALNRSSSSSVLCM